MVELVNRTAEADISRAHTDFVANASHELRPRWPRSSAMSRRSPTPTPRSTRPPRTKFHATVLREARRLQALVRT